MALLPKVGRRSPKLRLGIAILYVMLCLGGLTMVYPFLVTLTGAVSNNFDYEQYGWYPRYLLRPEQRYYKYLAEKYGDPTRFDYFRSAYGTPSHWGSFRDIAEDDDPAEFLPLHGAERDPVRWEKLQRMADDYAAFLTVATTTREGAEDVLPLFLRYNLEKFQSFIARRYETIAQRLNPALTSREVDAEHALLAMAAIRGDRYEAFSSVSLDMFNNYAFNLAKWFPQLSGRHLDYVDWVATLPPEEKLPVTRRYLWWSFLQRRGVGVSDYNALAGLTGTEHELASLEAVAYPVGDALPPPLETLRGEFLSGEWPVRLCRFPDLDRPAFEAALKEIYGTVEAMNTAGGTDYAAWGEVPLDPALPALPADTDLLSVDATHYNMLRSAWRVYAEEQLRQGARCERRFPEKAYQDFLQGKYGTIDAVNAAYGWNAALLADLELPIPEIDYVHYARNRAVYLRKFLFYNYHQVFLYLVTHGRAFFNTFVLVALTILATLTVNPLAAYALSRFRLRFSNQILIFLLATMAFPAEVAMIPSFLLLRDFNLLNTYGALILPSLANGFSIFLLKGFFDSLPKELYEAASIDGATETRMFLSITLPLCKPILAVIALNAFIAAYGGFMWAFLSCQNPEMWTIMVFLYQFQQTMRSQPDMVMAALVLASLPTLLVFVFCQKIILRGIIIPTMK